MVGAPSLVPRPLPDFISQPWRKIRRRPGTITTSRTGNGGLDSYVMWTRFHNDGNMPTQYAASTKSDRTVKFANSYRLCKYQVANEGCVDVSGRRYACTSTEESSRLRASASLRV